MPRLREACLRHASHYETVARAARDLYMHGGASLKYGLDMFDSEWENIKAGQEWAELYWEEDDAAAVLCSAFPGAGLDLLSLRQHPHERVRWLEVALAAARHLEQRYTEGILWGNLGVAYADGGDMNKAIKCYEQSLVVRHTNYEG